MTGSLTIGEVADRTGVAVATLRVWELRHGFPVPERLASGHRRYAAGDVEAIREVSRLRGTGLQLEAAIERAVAATKPASELTSVYAELRRRHPGLPVHQLTKRTLIGFSHAIEDEVGSRAQRAVLFGAFQTQVYYRHAAERWSSLARVAQAAYVFADFDATGHAGGVDTVPLAPDAPMRGEWVVGCDAPELAVVLAAWELPGQDHLPDAQRRFESIWTLDGAAVRDACLAAIDVAEAAGVDTAALVARLAGQPPSGAPDPAHATALVHRVLTYVDRA